MADAATARELRGVEPLEDATASGPRCSASISSSIRAPARREPDEHDPSVARDADPLDEAALLHPVDETGRVADSETSSMSASRLIVISPWCSSSDMMWSCAMLMPSRTSRSLPRT